MPPSTASQQDRRLELRTAAGKDALLVRRILWHEELSQPFHLQVELLTSKPDLNFDKLLGDAVCLRYQWGVRGKERFFHGHINHLEEAGVDHSFIVYRATIVPWLWFLSRTHDCRIFQNQSVPDIVAKIFSELPGSKHRKRLARSYSPREYCVQYRESDFDFVSRLLEEEGIYYYFEHTQDGHTLVLADDKAAHDPSPGHAQIRFQAPTGPGAVPVDRILAWTCMRQVEPGRLVLKDYNFTEPRSPLLAQAAARRRHALGDLEVFDYPGRYQKADQGERYSKLRLEELQARTRLYHGESSVHTLAAGQLFSLQNHYRPEANQQYLLTRVNMELANNAYQGGTGDSGLNFHCQVGAIESAQPFRPARLTPKPVVRGPQTAVVVGPKGEEIYVDENAQVKVQFHWDRYGKRDENSSCWVRVSQPWAGKGYGGMNIPRIGCEVIVDFLEGDPDQPIITGRVYNQDTMPNASNAGRDGKPGNSLPNSIKQAAMMTSFKSQSTPGGGGANEITMNDDAGSEGLFFKAQKDEIHNVGNDREDSVGNNETRKVANDRSREVGNNETVKVGVNRDKNVGSNETETIGANKSVTIGANLTEKIGKNMSLSVTMMKDEKVGLASTESVGAAKMLSVGAAYQISVGGVMNETVGGAKMVEVALSSSETVGGTASLKAKKVTITADDEIAIKVGGAQITMKKSGDISIKGNNIKIKGSKIEQN